ncbi:DALR anticodon-binding domain-containing protein [Streptomyces sp. NBC_01275]|uniref:ArgS-related anticodon-binding protein NrtL n=1 Tax=Streptomyces sp. NBC_01275 TaxID=2903807 RepID=UPI0022513A84|nr:DALR anticodon-binding domain-containing protein [Streptomyces sp. NBC_01275]MCX4764983.1 DALR anticodon-binding domain-containing protein [Streptomyces sp. NBC_01275]
MTPVELSRTVLHAVRRAVDAGELRVAVPVRAVVGPPGPGGRGDYATNIALQLARPAGQPPLRVAEVLQPHLARAEGVTGVEITGPGFLNISLDRSAAADLVQRIRREGLAYGHTDALAGQVFELRVPYEVRAEVLADALARIIASQGGRVAIEHRGRTAGPGPLASPATPARLDLRPVPAPEDPAPLGPDAARWALLHPAPHDRPRITADHLVQRESNPVFRVRYAHARTRAASRNAADLGFTADVDVDDVPQALHPASRPEPHATSTPVSTPAAPHLVALLADHPRVLGTVGVLPRAEGVAAVSRLTRHLLAVADATLVLLPDVLPRGEEKPSAAHRARLALAEAAGTVLAGGLSLLGIDAPEHL